ncbi:MAG: TatD family hydrolase [Candidatus Woesearchaeota archaeon]
MNLKDIVRKAAKPIVIGVAASILAGSAFGCYNTTPNAEPMLETKSYPIIDMHAHWQPDISTELMLENMSRANVVKAVIMPNSGHPYDAAQSLASQYPDKFVAFVGFQNKEWIQQRPGFIDNYVEQALQTNEFKGLGEVLLRHYAIPQRNAPDINIPATSDSVYHMLELAAKYNVPIVIHMEAEETTVKELEKLLKDNPTPKVIWAHAGRAESSTIERLFETYGNLYIDLSALDPSRIYGREKNPITTENGILKSEWKNLLVKYRDRIMTGSDTPFPDLWKKYVYVDIMDSQRALLEQLPDNVAEKIAYKNASVMLGIDLQK